MIRSNLYVYNILFPSSPLNHFRFQAAPVSTYVSYDEKLEWIQMIKSRIPSSSCEAALPIRVNFSQFNESLIAIQRGFFRLWGHQSNISNILDLQINLLQVTPFVSAVIKPHWTWMISIFDNSMSLMQGF